MRRMIPVVDLTTGSVSERPSYTRTLDLPSDLHPEQLIVMLDFRSRARYRSVLGREIVRDALCRPLSWRVRGEQCLVAESETPATIDQPSRYAVRSIDPGRA